MIRNSTPIIINRSSTTTTTFQRWCRMSSLTPTRTRTIPSNSISRSMSSNNRLCIGGSKLISPHLREEYTNVIQTALNHGVNTFEAAPYSVPGGEDGLVKAYQLALERNNSISGNSSSSSSNVVLMGRFGYRSQSDSSTSTSFGGDVTLPSDVTNVGLNDGGAVHNISEEYIQTCLTNSPLVKFKQQDDNCDVIYTVHNPEEQGSMSSLPSGNHSNDGLVKERLTEAFRALEEACSNGSISSYGVSSNGLSLPKDHPMHLDWMDVLDAACQAANSTNGGTPTAPKLSTIHLPANLLETNGILVSKQITAFLQNPSKYSLSASKSQTLYPSKQTVDICVTRPLTCYPDMGTGVGQPFKLVDYHIDSSNYGTVGTKEWTHLMSGPPLHYQPSFNAAMGHFDAEHLLEAESLSDIEQETLEGCRLLQQMLRDLDAMIQSSSTTSSSITRSISAYETHLYTQIIPLISNTFEELDEESASVLQQFFVSHGCAVRYEIAKTTRNLLESGGEGVTPYRNIPKEIMLQEFALGFLLGDSDSSSGIDKVLVGCSSPNHVLEAVKAADVAASFRVDHKN